MSPGPPHWAPGWLTIAIAGAAGFLLGVVVLVVARGVVHDTTKTHTVVKTRTIIQKPKVPNVVGLSLGDADQTLRDAGYETDVTGGGFFGAGESDPVQSQDPKAGSELPLGSTVTIDVG